jgi:hypothetical protein
MIDVFNIEQYSLDRTAKAEFLFPALRGLHEHHLQHSKEYASVAATLFPHHASATSIEELPFLPVSVFKNYQLKSVADEEIIKVLTSSGTTGQAVSRIYLDKHTAQMQTKALSKIIGHVVGTKRLPMLIVDSKSVLSNRASFSARGAGILGLSVFGKDHTYVLDDNLELMEPVLEEFLQTHSGQPVLIFGFTFMVWLYLYSASLSGKYDLSRAILIHSGGWKKLVDLSVDNETFKQKLREKFGLQQVYNFYGMVEQVGSVFLENSDGSLHCPNFADVIIRNPVDFSVQKEGEPGLIQVLSTLPHSYPGHSLLTEDLGVLTGTDSASNGWKGRSFKVLGRAKKAELRGCSDTFTSPKR